MISIALIHTVKTVANTFEKELQSGLSKKVKVHNLWDDFLANNPNEIGEFTITNRNRLFNDIKSAELTGADIIVVTCSTLTPIVEKIRPFVRGPLVAIDDAMCRKGVTYGERILVMATAESTVEPTITKLDKEAAKKGIKITIDSLVHKEAFGAMKNLDMEKHDILLKKQAEAIQGYDCIILAQASMAHLDQEIEKICNCPVLSSTKLCIESVSEIVNML